MRITWVGNKRELANEKHFNSALTKEQVDLLVLKVIKNVTHVGQSDRSNGSHSPAKILWGNYNGKTYAIVMDSKKLKSNVVEIISFYDVFNKEHKAKRFDMKEVKK